MAELTKLEFFVLEYAPYAVRRDRVSVGVVLMEPSSRGSGFADVRFRTDWRFVRCLDASANLEYFEKLEAHIRGQLGTAEGRQSLLRDLQDRWSGAIQLSPVTPCLALDPQAEMDALFEQFLAVPKATARPEPSERVKIRSKMREAFERANVWPMLDKEIPIEEYTHRGDPLRIDCGYKPNGIIKLFHAVSLTTSVDPAKVLAFSYPQMAEGMRRKQKAEVSLTAVVDDDLDRNHDEIGFALVTLGRSGIAVVAAAEMPGYAEIARKELHA